MAEALTLRLRKLQPDVRRIYFAFLVRRLDFAFGDGLFRKPLRN